MSRQAQLINRFRSNSIDFTWDELIQLLNRYNFSEVSKGKSSRSRRAFVNKSTQQIIRIHQRYPAKILEQYQIREIREVLEI